MELIKNHSLISRFEPAKSRTTIEICRDNVDSHLGVTRLSDVLNFLPAGLIYKSETGMGATTLELIAERHSIVVQPLKITASSKAKAHNAVYVGSPTKFEPEPFNKPEDIRLYDQYEQIPYKKYVVVADSLPKIIDALGPKVFDKYFLLIDDVDSFQLDSSFRDSMEKCIDIYLRFSPRNRALLSATLLKFSNPLLKKEHITIIKYNLQVARKINILHAPTQQLLSCVYDRLVSTLNDFPADKIFVALNSVSDSFNLACKLVDNGVLPPSDIKVLCSSASEKRVGEFYVQLEDTMLPARINFFTSAYFTGFDVNESYHLISVSGSGSRYKVLSDKRLKQIVGRSRVGVLSETVIQDSRTPIEATAPTVKQLEGIANSIILTKACIEHHFSSHSMLRLFTKDITDRFLSVLEEKEMKFVRRDVDDAFQVSYLNIDFYLEAFRVRKTLYSDKRDLYNTLKKDGHTVFFSEVFSAEKVEDKKMSQIERDKQIQEIFEKIKGFCSSLDIDFLIRDEERSLTPFQKHIAKSLRPIIGYLDEGVLHDILKRSLLGKRDTREFNRKIVSAEFATYSEGYNFVDRLNHYFPNGSKLSSDQILTNMNLYMGELMTGKFFTEEADAKKFLNTLKKVKRCPTKGGEVYYIVKGDNPFNFNILRKREGLGKTDILTAIKGII